MERLANSLLLCRSSTEIPTHSCSFWVFTNFLSHQWDCGNHSTFSEISACFSVVDDKFHAIPHPDEHLYPHLPLTHHSQPGSGHSSGGHRPVLAEPLLLPGAMPDFASCLLSSSHALHPGVHWGKSEWNKAEQINIHREGTWGICNQTAWMLGSSACNRRGKSKGKVYASEGQQPGPSD